MKFLDSKYITTSLKIKMEKGTAKYKIITIDKLCDGCDGTGINKSLLIRSGGLSDSVCYNCYGSGIITTRKRIKETSLFEALENFAISICNIGDMGKNHNHNHNHNK